MVIKILSWFVLGVVVLFLSLNIAKIPGWIQKLKAFYGEVVFEMTKVAWPKRSQVVNSTMLVGIVTVVLAVMIGFVDSIFGKLAMLIFRG